MSYKCSEANNVIWQMSSWFLPSAFSTEAALKTRRAWLNTSKLGTSSIHKPLSLTAALVQLGVRH